MKVVFFLLMMLSNTVLILAQDSTKIILEYPGDRVEKLSNELNGIKIVKLICPDSSMLGSMFKLYIGEFRQGTMQSLDSFGIECKDQKFPVLIGNDTAFVFINMCERISYTSKCIESDPKCEGFEILMGGKFTDDTFNLKIKYPGIGFNTSLKCNEDYDLRVIQQSRSDTLLHPLNKRFAIMSFGPPFKGNSQLNHYCLLNTENSDQWYDKFGIEHFYIIYLRIQ
ncbi:hypothetical protein GYB22_04265 [bacterium]|nr:hypothetical protein [bacterium]